MVSVDLTACSVLDLAALVIGGGEGGVGGFTSENFEKDIFCLRVQDLI